MAHAHTIYNIHNSAILFYHRCNSNRRVDRQLPDISDGLCTNLKQSSHLQPPNSQIHSRQLLPSSPSEESTVYENINQNQKCPAYDVVVGQATFRCADDGTVYADVLPAVLPHAVNEEGASTLAELNAETTIVYASLDLH